MPKSSQIKQPTASKHDCPSPSKTSSTPQPTLYQSRRRASRTRRSCTTTHPSEPVLQAQIAGSLELLPLWEFRVLRSGCLFTEAVRLISGLMTLRLKKRRLLHDFNHVNLHSTKTHSSCHESMIKYRSTKTLWKFT